MRVVLLQLPHRFRVKIDQAHLREVLEDFAVVWVVGGKGG
jgi:hypothetical protein